MRSRLFKLRRLPSIAWSLQSQSAGWPGYNGYLELIYDSLANRTLLYGVPAGSSSIYSTNLYTYRADTNLFTKLGGNDAMSNTCTDTGPTWPGDRHPVGQMAFDTLRNGLWLHAGVCGGNNWAELWFFGRSDNTWTKLTPATIPTPRDSAAMVYSPDDDVIFLFGSDGGAQTHCNWVYCPTSSRSAAQIAAGCSAGETWTEVSVAGGVQPSGVAFPRLVYDLHNRKVIQYGGNTGGGTTQNQLWAYDIPTKTWTRKQDRPPLYTGPASPPTFAMVYVPLLRMFVYHQTHGTGAPRDWAYDLASNDWMVLQSAGDGSTVDTMAAFDASQNRIIAYCRKPDGTPNIWHGVLN